MKMLLVMACHIKKLILNSFEKNNDTAYWHANWNFLGLEMHLISFHRIPNILRILAKTRIYADIQFLYHLSSIAYANIKFDNILWLELDVFIKSIA